MRRERRAWLPAASALAAVPLLLLGMRPAPAEAFPWMIHHGYTGCAQCHVDPSGAGVLTDYGRAQGDILLRTHYGEAAENPGKGKDFLFGVLDLPDTVALQADVRGLLIPDPAAVRFILMQSDLRGAVQTEKVSVSASLGAVSEGGEQAAVSSGPGAKLVAREYWLGYSPSKSFTLRAGRMNLPFGIRTEDHVLDVRDVTRTNTNDAQQTGVSVFYNSRKWRAEAMGIAGNFQVRPDSFRDRGYSLYASYAPINTLELGVSSLLVAAKTDLDTHEARTRGAEGLFVRWAPIPEVAVLAEGDLLIDRTAAGTTPGLASTAIVDYEPLQGLHLQAIGEQCDDDLGDASASSLTGTAAAQWFFAPHADLRVDGGYGTVFCTPGVAGSPFGLVQAHFYL